MRAHGFTLVDLLVSIAVIALLIGLLLPTLSTVRETSRRVICSSNIRQVGLALAMYSDDDRREMLPSSVYSITGLRADMRDRPHEMLAVRVLLDGTDGGEAAWDGLGLLYDEYLSAPGVFYCPSHTGEHPFSRYESLWRAEGHDSAEILSNYQYRGTVDGRALPRYLIPSSVAIVSDGLRTKADYNHRVGSNVLRIDSSVIFHSDSADSPVLSSLPDSAGEVDAADKVRDAWNMLDLP